MPNEDIGNNNQSDSTAPSANEPAPAKLDTFPITSEHDGHDPDRHKDDPARENKPPGAVRLWIGLHREKLKHVGLNEWLMLAATVVMAASTVVYTIYTSKTLDAINANSKASGVQADQIIGNMNWFAQSMDASVKQAQAALRSSIETSRNDQRAWVGVVSINGADYTDTLGGITKRVYTKEGDADSPRNRSVILL